MTGHRVTPGTKTARQLMASNAPIHRSAEPSDEVRRHNDEVDRQRAARRRRKADKRRGGA